MSSRNADRALQLLCFGAVFCLFSSELMAEATLSLKAVARNGIPISPTSALQIQPEDVITAEIFLSGWNNPPFDGGAGLLHLYQIRLAVVAGALSSNACGPCNIAYVLPLGWDAPLNRELCPCNNPCFQVCESSQCVGPSFNSTQIAKIDTTRVDWIFHGFTDLSAVDVSTVNIRWGSVIFENGGQMASRCKGGSLEGFGCTKAGDCPGGFCDANYQSYVGTVNLKAGVAICGSYEISFDANETWVSNGTSFDKTFPAMEGLSLTTGLPCPACPVCFPANCTIDARRPFPPGQPSAREGFASWTWNFQRLLTTSEDAPEDFIVWHTPSVPPFPPIIESVFVDQANGLVTLHFSGPIGPNGWTCVRHIASGIDKCLGYLPGDADSSRLAKATDILKLIDNLNGVADPPLTEVQCDIDRSGVCMPADIITEIDLLNGAGDFPSQGDRSLPLCPSG